MHLFLAIALTSLALVAGMYLLAKTRTENLGKFFSVVSWFVIVVSVLSLLCQVGQSALMMACHTGICPPSENCMPGMMHKEIYMHGGRMHGGCDEMEECCEGGGYGKGMSGCCEMGQGHGHGEGYQHGEGRHGCMGDDDENDDAVKKDSVSAK